MMEIIKRFPECLPDMMLGDCQIFVNKGFCQHTDIPLPKDFRENEDILLVVERKDGKMSIPLRKMKNHSVDLIPEEMAERSSHILYLPLHWQDEVYGYMALECGDYELDYERMKDFMMAMAQILGTVKKQSELYDMYIRDALTGLYNRRGFYGEFTRQMKNLAGKDIRIFMASVDLDHLKSINDNFGHSEGDVAIKAIADALSEAAGDKGICARFGGDEYVALCLWKAGTEPEAFVDIFEKRLQSWISQWNATERKAYELGASTGIIMESIQDVNEIDELMKKADDHMYDCKVRHHSIRASRRE